jgi:hypothetical protein
LTTDASEIVSIEFSPLPMPAVVAGDTLRDTTGKATPLAAKLFTAAGHEATGAAITFLTPDSLVTISVAGILVAKPNVSGLVRLVATGAGLQSVQQQIQVVPRPDTIVPKSIVDTLRFFIPDDPKTNVSGEIGVKVESFDSTTQTYKPVPKWIVHFRLVFRGDTVAAQDTSVVFLMDASGKRSATDTTDDAGGASRRVRYKVSGQAVALDSIIVLAESKYRGTLVPGSPVRMVLPVKPK